MNGTNMGMCVRLVDLDRKNETVGRRLFNVLPDVFVLSLREKGEVFFSGILFRSCFIARMEIWQTRTIDLEKFSCRNPSELSLRTGHLPHLTH